MPPLAAIGWKGQEQGALGTPSAALPVGGYMGEVMVPVPEKLVRKIVDGLQFVEMRKAWCLSWKNWSGKLWTCSL